MFARLVVIVALLAARGRLGRAPLGRRRQGADLRRAGRRHPLVDRSRALRRRPPRGGLAARGPEPPGRLARPPGPAPVLAVPSGRHRFDDAVLDSAGMDLDVVFLGTAGSMPTADRSPTALLVRRGGERLLFDCAEGTQRQLLRSIARADRPPRGLPHPLPRRPLPRAARDAEDVRAARPRGADHDLRPARARRAVPVAAPDLREAHLPVRARGAPSRRHARPRRLPPA